MAKIQRRGDVEKCPACGWRLDPGAYRCPKCRIYFCYKCRARVGKWEEQFQCANQSCDCYGKLLCSDCVVPVDQTQTIETPRRDATVAALIGGGVVGAASLAFAPFVVAAGLGIGAVVAGSYALRALGLNVWGSTDLKDQHSYTYQHLCCEQCLHPVEDL